MEIWLLDKKLRSACLSLEVINIINITASYTLSFNIIICLIQNYVFCSVVYIYFIFLILTGHAIGRDAFLDNGIIPPVAKLFDDKEDIARKNSHQAIEMISETPPGAEGIVNANLVPILVQKLSTEKDEIKVEHSYLPYKHLFT